MNGPTQTQPFGQRLAMQQLHREENHLVPRFLALCRTMPIDIVDASNWSDASPGVRDALTLLNSRMMKPFVVGDGPRGSSSNATCSRSSRSSASSSSRHPPRAGRPGSRTMRNRDARTSPARKAGSGTSGSSTRRRWGPGCHASLQGIQFFVLAEVAPDREVNL